MPSSHEKSPLVDDVGSDGSRIVGTPWLGLCLPLILMAVIIFLSPNFRQSESGAMRDKPLGGDLVQDWVGGYIAGSAKQEDRDRLYDLTFVKAIQHDSSIVGFSWPKGDYFPMVYPPFYYQAMQPIALVSFPLAIKIWGVICALAVSLAAFLLFRFFEPSRGWVGIGVLAALFFFPLITCLTMGQKSTLLLLILTATFVLLHHNKPLPAGLLFGLIAFKPHLGIVIGLTMLLKRQWAFAVGAILSVGLMVGVSFWHNPSVWRDYVSVVSGMNDYVESGGYRLTQSHSLWGAMQLTFAEKFSSSVVKVIAGAVSIAVLVLLWRIMRGTVATSSQRFACQFSAMVLVTVMLSPHFYTYDLTILLLPMLLIATSLSAASRAIGGGVDGKVGTHKICLQLLGFLLVALFVGAGVFEKIASQIGFQFSLVVMIGVLFTLANVLPVSSCSQPSQAPLARGDF